MEEQDFALNTKLSLNTEELLDISRQFIENSNITDNPVFYSELALWSPRKGSISKGIVEQLKTTTK